MISPAVQARIDKIENDARMALSRSAEGGPVDLGYVTLEEFGAKGDGVTNDQPAYAAALATGKTILLGAKTYLVQGGTLTADRQGIIGFGQESRLRTVSNQPVVQINGTTQHTLSMFAIEGNGVGASQHGISNGLAAFAASGDPLLITANVTVTTMGGDGFQFFQYKNVGLHEGGGNTAARAISCVGYGFNVGVGAEFTDLVNCSSETCGIGIGLFAGNFVLSGCIFSDCGDGVEVSTANNHGLFSGCSVVHSVRYVVNAHDCDDGCTFDNCILVFGTIHVVNVNPASGAGNQPFIFDGGRIDVAGREHGGAAGPGTQCAFGTTYRNVCFTGALANTVTNNLNGFPSTTFYYDCFDGEGGVAATQEANMVPSVLLGAVSWYRADMGATMANQTVTALADEGAPFFGALANLAGGQPKYTLLDEPALAYAGAATNGLHSAPHAVVPQPICVYLVAQSYDSAPGGGHYFLSFKTAAHADVLALFQGVGVDSLTITGGVGSYSSGKSVVSGPQAIVAIFENATPALYQNSRSPLGVPVALGADNAYELSLGATDTDTVSLNGAIWECLVVTSTARPAAFPVLTPSEVDFLMALAKERYDITLAP